ncbi:unnamed protein product [Lactuca saligna]|uniref:Uncharacterized protein n=1 Tax=Lactuca saligna TaxID=75948 RepID=A0AA35Z528_LACSI|nr:unnamed protein product [Lactuca saligna]
MLKVKTCFSLLITLYVSHTLTLRYLLYLGVFRLLASKILKNKLDVTKFNFPVAGTDLFLTPAPEGNSLSQQQKDGDRSGRKRNRNWEIDFRCKATLMIRTKVYLQFGNKIMRVN